MYVNWLNLTASALYLCMAIQVLCGKEYSATVQAVNYFVIAVVMLIYSFLFKKEG